MIPRSGVCEVSSRTKMVEPPENGREAWPSNSAGVTIFTVSGRGGGGGYCVFSF